MIDKFFINLYKFIKKKVFKDNLLIFKRIDKFFYKYYIKIYFEI